MLSQDLFPEILPQLKLNCSSCSDKFVQSHIHDLPLMKYQHKFPNASVNSITEQLNINHSMTEPPNQYFEKKFSLSRFLDDSSTTTKTTTTVATEPEYIPDEDLLKKIDYNNSMLYSLDCSFSQQNNEPNLYDHMSLNLRDDRVPLKAGRNALTTQKLASTYIHNIALNNSSTCASLNQSFRNTKPPFLSAIGEYSFMSDKSTQDSQRQNAQPQMLIKRELIPDYTSIFSQCNNINIVLPLYLPHGTIAILNPSGYHAYAFPDSQVAAQLFFTEVGQVCNLLPSNLRLRVAVIRQCPTILTPLIARLFTTTMSLLPKFSSPIPFSCRYLNKHKIRLKSSSKQVLHRYDTVGEYLNEHERLKMCTILTYLQQMLVKINYSLAVELEKLFTHYLQSDRGRKKDVNSKLRHKSWLQFRFSPSRELKIILREGYKCVAPGLDTISNGKGAPRLVSYIRKFKTEPLYAGELRLERDKCIETQYDPCFYPEYKIKTRRMLKTETGEMARIVFVEPEVYPKTILPKVVRLYGATPRKAAEIIYGSTFKLLYSLLPYVTQKDQNELPESKPEQCSRQFNNFTKHQNAQSKKNAQMHEPQIYSTSKILNPVMDRMACGNQILDQTFEEYHNNQHILTRRPLYHEIEPAPSDDQSIFDSSESFQKLATILRGLAL